MSERELIGVTHPAELKCAICRKRITRTTPKVFFHGKFWCSECQYYAQRGETPPGARS